MPVIEIQKQHIKFLNDQLELANKQILIMSEREKLIMHKLFEISEAYHNLTATDNNIKENK